MTNRKAPVNDIPEPHYTLIETSRGPDPAIVVVNSALRAFQHRDWLPWHLSIHISCPFLGDNGMPTAEENQVLYGLEDTITKLLADDKNAVFLARVTCRGERELTYRVHDPDLANTHLEKLVSDPNSPRQWEYHMEHDSPWTLAQPELSLLEHDSRFN
jgi:hypothetical protein